MSFTLLFTLISGGNIQYANPIPSVTIPTPRSPTNSKPEMNVASLPSNATASHVQVVDSSHAVATATEGGNNSRVRGRVGRGRGKGSSRGRRSTSGPPPEIDHNIEVRDIETGYEGECMQFYSL